MSNRIHIFGASGSGVSTLGKELSIRINGLHLDTDDYYWQLTDPPFTVKRDPQNRIEMILTKVEGRENWVLSGSLCSWGDPLLSQFTLAVFLQLDSEIRMERLRERERQRFGSRILPDGDMHQQHLQFMEWAESYDSAKAPIRSFDLHMKWMRRLNCSVLRLNSENAVEELVDQVVRELSLSRE